MAGITAQKDMDTKENVESVVKWVINPMSVVG